jgi:predicted Zn-dependent protease
MMRAAYALFLSAVLTLSTGCASDRQVIEQAEGAHNELEPAVMEDPELRDYLQGMGQRIVDAAHALHDEHYGPDKHFDEDSQWMFSPDMKFHFVNSKTLNAFTTGGTHMYIYTELLQTCRTKDELAAVMAHEYGHVYGRHVQKGMDRQYWTLGGAVLAGSSADMRWRQEHGLEYGAAPRRSRTPADSSSAWATRAKTKPKRTSSASTSTCARVGTRITSPTFSSN